MSGEFRMNVIDVFFLMDGRTVFLGNVDSLAVFERGSYKLMKGSSFVAGVYILSEERPRQFLPPNSLRSFATKDDISRYKDDIKKGGYVLLR